MNTYKKLFSFLLVGVLVIVGGFAFLVPKTNAAATIAVSSALITGPNKITIVFIPVNVVMLTAPITAFGAGALVLTAGGARSITNLDSLTVNTAIYTFDGAPAARNETALLTVTTPTLITDTASANTFNATLSPITIGDGQAPTITSVTPLTGTSINASGILSYTLSEWALSTIRFTWMSGPADTQEIHTYSLLAPSTGVMTFSIATLNGNETFALINPLVNGAVYKIDINAWDAANNQAAQNETLNITYDATPPSLSSVVWTPTGGHTSISAGDTIAITFSEPMDTSTLTTSNVDFRLLHDTGNSFNATGTGGSFSWNDGSTVLTIVLGTATTVADSGEIIAPTADVSDLAGNSYDTSSTLPITNNVRPTYTAVVTSPTSITLTFSENVTTLGGDIDGDGWAISGTDANGVTVTGNTNPDGAGKTMVLTLNGALSGGTHPVVNVDYTQLSGTTVDLNSNQVADNSSEVASESIKPTVSYIHTVGSATTSATSVDFSVKFSEPVTDVLTTDFVTNGTVSSSSITGVAATGDPSVYTVSVNTGTGNGTLWLDVVSGMGVMDLNGNVLTDNTSTSEIYIINKTPPPPVRGGGGHVFVPITATLTEVSGCKNRTTGFSIVTGQSCVTNIPHNEQAPNVGLFHFTLLLKMGSSENEVAELQKFLNKTPYNSGLVTDGKFGPKTKFAVIKFQLANGLKGDGIVGPLTRTILNK